MNALSRTPLALVLIAALSGVACSEEARNDARQATAEAKATVDDAVAQTGVVSEALAEAREKMKTENLPLGSADGLPKAELTPQGDVLINGVAVPMTPAQREAALAYRTEILAVADAGMVMGEKGVAIAGDALALAATGIFGGDTTEGEARIEAKGKAMEAEGLAMCQRVASLEIAQNRLAELLPAFQPYAKAMNVKADCNVADTSEDAEQQADEAASAPAATPSVST